MMPTEGGRRLFGIAVQMIALHAEAEEVVRAQRAERLHVVATGAISEFVTQALTDEFGRRRAMETTSGEVSTDEIALLLTSRVADVALGPRMDDPRLACEPVLRCRIVVVGGRGGRRDMWLVDPSAADSASDTSRLLQRLRIPESRVRVLASQTASWDAAASGAGVAPAVGHLVGAHLRRGDLTLVETAATPMDVRWYATTLRPDARSMAATSFVEFLSTPTATQLMRSPGAGVPRSRYRPPVHVSIWRP